MRQKMDKATKQVTSFTAQQGVLAQFVFEEFSDLELADVVGKLAGLKSRLEKACLKVALDF